MTIDTMIQIKKEKGYSCRQLSEFSGVPLSTVQKIFSKVTTTPRYETLRALEDALCDYHPPKKKKKIDYRTFEPGKPLSVEESVAYKADKKLYTIEDYFNLPEDRRAELIDGVFYEMNSPAIIHQIIIGEMYIQFINCAKEHAGNCRVLLSPVSVRLDQDNLTMVQPDIIIVCDLKELPRQYIDGAPDLVVEVLSPSTRRKDMTLKLQKYRDAGVREYWMVDPKTQEVIVYDFSDLKFPRTYSFTDKIPVIISQGKCTVDLSEVAKDISLQADE